MGSLGIGAPGRGCQDPTVMPAFPSAPQWEPVQYFNNKIICDLVEEKFKGIISILVSPLCLQGLVLEAGWEDVPVLRSLQAGPQRARVWG